MVISWSNPISIIEKEQNNSLGVIIDPLLAAIVLRMNRSYIYKALFLPILGIKTIDEHSQIANKIRIIYLDQGLKMYGT